MVIYNEQSKIKYMILTFLCCYRGMKFTGNEIARFLIMNKLINKEVAMNSRHIFSTILRDRNNSGILRDIKTEKKNGVTYYYLEDFEDMPNVI